MAARRAQRLGYLVPHAHRYERQKIRTTRWADARALVSSPAATGAVAPTSLREWSGINNPHVAPPDETSAVGTARYIELINTNYAIYTKTNDTPIATGRLNGLAGVPADVAVFDPQIMWDGQTNRFYYAADVVVSSGDNRVAFGFSKTSSPTGARDWCKYNFAFGSTFPDYPKLGDSQHFGIIGTNLFSPSGHFVGPYIQAISKPGGGTTCPPASSLSVAGRVVNGGFTPVPASEIDANKTGWVVARGLTMPSNKLQLYKVARAPTGNPVITATPSSVIVPGYSRPANAPEMGADYVLDTLDARNTQAQAAIDPSHGGRFALWTQHTVRGGGGAELRWYEIDPATHSVIQKRRVTSPSLYEFNGAIAPNRQVTGATQNGGNAMVMSFNVSSASTFPSIKMVSKIGHYEQSGQVPVFNGTSPLTGFDCTAVDPGPCRWGDYAAATPDPSANRIWQVSQYGDGTDTSTYSTSRTWNFVAAP